MRPLPIDPLLGEIAAALAVHPRLVLVAPPGAGKTTRVPLSLLDAEVLKGQKILMLLPRRLAARAAAQRMADSLGERVGETIGLRIRFGAQTSSRTRIEVMTEGVFTRLIVEDPTLSGVGLVIFDEFHERALEADLGLALALDVQSGLREDLRLLVMSATLDDLRLSSLLKQAPVIRSEGASFPVDIRYVGRGRGQTFDQHLCDVILRAVRQDHGSLLVFLPGSGEIRKMQRLLAASLDDPAVEVHALHGGLDLIQQQAAIAPPPAGVRKLVLATSIAETSLTIEGVRVVIDSGLSRRPVFEPDMGVTRLDTMRVSQAAARQRAGRAGRLEAGVCYRLWDGPETSSLPAFHDPEILHSDLSSLMLDLAAWGVRDPSLLSWLDSPPPAAWAQARATLEGIGALDADGRLTETGRRIHRFPLPPRLARMVLTAAQYGQAQTACEIAMLLGERGLGERGSGGTDADLSQRLAAFRTERSPRALQAKAMIRSWMQDAHALTPVQTPLPLSCGVMVAMAFPDRIARSRGGDGTSFLMANGRGVTLDATASLAGLPFLAIAAFSGSAAAGRILDAAPLTLAEIEQVFADDLVSGVDTLFDRSSRRLRRSERLRLGALVLKERSVPIVADDETAPALLQAVRRHGLEILALPETVQRWRQRAGFLHRTAPDLWPDLTDTALSALLDDWLAPILAGVVSLDDLDAPLLMSGLSLLMPYDLARRMDQEAPDVFVTPSGRSVLIDYSAEAGPTVSVRVQEMFGLDQHPCLMHGRVPLVIELLSPARRPVQTTRDLPGFWAGSYAAVRAEMRGRYPRHPWPDHPQTALPTAMAKKSPPSSGT